MILLPIFAELQAYLRAVEDHAIPRPSRCVGCGNERVWFVGWYQRYVNVLVTGGRRLRDAIRVRRCRCAQCRKSFGLLPAFLYPHRQFGLETTEWILLKWLGDPAAHPGDLRGARGWGPSERTVRRWLGWTDERFDEATIQSELLELDPEFPLGSVEPIRVRGGEPKDRALGGRHRARRVARILAYVRAWHRAGRRHRRTSDRWALRSYLRHLWSCAQGLVVYLTRAPGAPQPFYPPDAT